MPTRETVTKLCDEHKSGARRERSFAHKNNDYVYIF
jgi:hypothetical protein